MLKLPQLSQKNVIDRHVAAFKTDVDAALGRALSVAQTASSDLAETRMGVDYVQKLQVFTAEKLLSAPADELRKLVIDVENIWCPYVTDSIKKGSYLYQINQELFTGIDYKAFANSHSDDWCGLLLMKELAKHVRYCPYCNAETIYAIRFTERGDTRMVKNAFDHYFPRARYPFLGLSLYNLIPACSRCNSNLKGSKYKDLVRMAHPYLDDVDKNMVFTLVYGKRWYQGACSDKAISSILFEERKTGTYPPGVDWGRLFKMTTVYTELFKQEAMTAVCRATMYSKSYCQKMADKLARKGLFCAPDVFLYGASLDRHNIDHFRHGKMIRDIVLANRVA